MILFNAHIHISIKIVWKICDVKSSHLQYIATNIKAYFRQTPQNIGRTVKTSQASSTNAARD